MEDKKPIVIGFFSGLLLLIVYFGILTIANSFSHAVEQFIGMWYWILGLVIGFGVQVSLYYYIRNSMHSKIAASTEIAAAGGISTGSMVACCLHHLTDVLPLIGLSAAAVVLTEYQTLFMVLGILSNFVGITFMLRVAQEHKLFHIKRGFIKKLFKYDMKDIFFVSLGIFLISLSLTVFNSTIEGVLLPTESLPEGITKDQIIPLQTKTNDEGRVSFEVTPIDFSYDKPVSFEISIDTHIDSLDFDLTEISVLEDDDGNKYNPIKWEGSSPGGHHRTGILSFPKLNGQTKYIKLVIKDVYGIPERVFVWNLE